MVYEDTCSLGGSGTIFRTKPHPLNPVMMTTSIPHARVILICIYPTDFHYQVSFKGAEAHLVFLQAIVNSAVLQSGD